MEMDSLTLGNTGPLGTHSRTLERNPDLETFASTVNPGLRRLDATLQPHTSKNGYTSMWFHCAGLGSGLAKAFIWKSSVLAILGVP